jgi:hypothetical protein
MYQGNSSHAISTPCLFASGGLPGRRYVVTAISIGFNASATIGVVKRLAHVTIAR